MIKLRRFLNNESGVTAIEYALIAALVAVAAIVAWNALGTSLLDKFNAIATTISTS